MGNFAGQFKDKGYFTYLDLFNDSEMESIRSKIDRIEAGEIGFPLRKIDHEPKNPSRLRKISDLSEYDYFFKFFKNQKIIEVMKKCIGEDLKLFGDKLFMKPT